jgi:hypothetical protein
MSILGWYSTAVMLVSAGLFVVVVSLDAPGFYPALARGWHEAVCSAHLADGDSSGRLLRIALFFLAAVLVSYANHQLCQSFIDTAGGSMPRSMVGLLAAVGVAMSSLVGLVHGYLPGFFAVVAAVSTGLVAYLSASKIKKKSSPCQLHCVAL